MKISTFSERNALITGASGGIGREIAIELANNGANLFLTGQDNNKLIKLEAILSDSGSKVFFQSCDLKEKSSMQSLLNAVKDKLGNIDILINCAGIFTVEDFENTKTDDFDDCISVNVRAPYFLTRSLIGNMVKNGWGRIVNIGSSSAYGGYKKTSIYCSSKHALLGLSKSLHDEFKEHNVRTYFISPGSVKTEMGQKVPNQDYNTFIDPNEIAKYVIFVMSFDSDLISEEVRLNRMRLQ